MEELLARLKTRLRYSGTTANDAILTEHLQTAIDVINERRQYTSTDLAIVEPQHESVVVELAISSYAKVGAEGQLAHDENGVDRMYESGFYPASILKLVIPKKRLM
jgi:hypothetical protein